MTKTGATFLTDVLQRWRGRCVEGVLESLDGDDPGEITSALGVLATVINSRGWNDGESIFDLDVPWGDS